MAICFECVDKETQTDIHTMSKSVQVNPIDITDDNSSDEKLRKEEKEK